MPQEDPACFLARVDRRRPRILATAQASILLALRRRRNPREQGRDKFFASSGPKGEEPSAPGLFESISARWGYLGHVGGDLAPLPCRAPSQTPRSVSDMNQPLWRARGVRGGGGALPSANPDCQKEGAPCRGARKFNSEGGVVSTMLGWMLPEISWASMRARGRGRAERRSGARETRHCRREVRRGRGVGK